MSQADVNTLSVYDAASYMRGRVETARVSEGSVEILVSWLESEGGGSSSRTIPNPSLTSTPLGDTLRSFATRMEAVAHITVQEWALALQVPRLSIHLTEGELLLGRGLVVEIVEAVDVNGTWHIDGELVPTPRPGSPS